MADTRTLEDMLDRIQAEILRTDFNRNTPTETHADDDGPFMIFNYVRDAIFDYQRETTFLGEKIDSSTVTVAGTHTYNTPADLIHILQLDIVANNTVTPLILRPYTIIDGWDTNTTPARGRPNYYGVLDSTVRLYPTPSANGWVLRYIYRYAIPEPVLWATTNFWTTTAEDLIRNRAKWYINSKVIRDQEAAELDKQAEERAYRRLSLETGLKLFTGRLTPWPNRQGRWYRGW